MESSLDKKEPEEGHSDDGKKDEKAFKSQRIRINMQAIPCISEEEQNDELRLLNVTAYNQSVYEESVLKQVDEALQSNCQSSSRKKNSTNILFDYLKSSESVDQHQKEHLEDCSFAGCDEDKQTGTAIFNLDSDSNQSDRETLETETSNFEIASKESDEISDNKISEDEWIPSEEDDAESEASDLSDNLETEEDFESEPNENKKRKSRESRKKTHKLFKKIVPKEFDSDEDKDNVPVVKQRRRKVVDDGNETHFRKRIKEHQRQRLIEKQQNIGPDGVEKTNLDKFVKIDEQFQVPERIWNNLYPYQQTGVKWLWELHKHGCGGIVGDEMGLGKTIQIIVFFAGLSSSTFFDFRDMYKSLGPVLLICPATVMHQWVSEFHLWWPPFRVAILHATGSFAGNKAKLVDIVNKNNGILITSYSSACVYQKTLLKKDWHYVILDEGHKIRNPDAQVTLTCKMFRTPHRIILSGSPIQNNLRELWSLFDFVYPGKLGTLPVFMEHFGVPITQGGYSNATKVQIQIAYKCATVLRDTIKPYLLRRMKDDVKESLELPGKNEQVLFCKLTEEQRTLYKSYITSEAVKDIFKGSTQIFVGLINLRKICNHPDIFTGRSSSEGDANEVERFGYYKKSGKMLVVEALLKIWFEQRHKVLLFTQSRMMLKVFTKFLTDKSYSFLTMDGSTPIGVRQEIIKQFNKDPDIFIFLLTTKVGGIGVNLIGANRVIIYDPDWNPSTDVQARERCWRIGQEKQVTIYRLICSGTVEEKIYHRQIFKQYLTNRVLKDPKQKRFFKTNDLHELFTLSDDFESETSALLSGTGSEVKLKSNKKKQKESTEMNVKLSTEKINEMRVKVNAISKMIAEKFKNRDEKSITNESNSGLPSEVTQNKDVNHSESTSKKSKKFKGLKFEGKRIKYLMKQDSYKTNDRDSCFDQNDYVLRKLFKKSNVQSALQHDKIEMPSNPEYSIVENEAETVAKEAIDALKRSRERCLGATSGVPTWTGSNLSSLKSNKFGQKRTNNKDATMSSTSLVAEIKKRNKLAPTSSSLDDDCSTNSQTVLLSEQNELLLDVRNFLAFQSKKNGEASTQEILDKFKEKLPPHQSAVFKAMLWKICDFHRGTDKVGIWKLKPEFR